MKLLQSETDKRVTQALATQEKKHKRELSLSKLDDNAREKAEQANRIAELEEQLAAFTIERNKSELKSVLAARGLSAEFADILLINDDIEASQANIDRLDKLFKNAVKMEVEKRLAGSTPKGNGGEFRLNFSPGRMRLSAHYSVRLREMATGSTIPAIVRFRRKMESRNWRLPLHYI
jgi:hypothetical protein